MHRNVQLKINYNTCTRKKFVTSVKEPKICCVQDSFTAINNIPQNYIENSVLKFISNIPNNSSTTVAPKVTLLKINKYLLLLHTSCMSKQLYNCTNMVHNSSFLYMYSLLFNKLTQHNWIKNEIPYVVRSRPFN